MNITNVDFNDFRKKYYYNFRSLREARLVNTRSKLTASSYKPHSSADNLKITIQSDPVSSSFDIVKTFYNDTNKIISVTNENKFVSPAQNIMIKKYQRRK